MTNCFSGSLVGTIVDNFTVKLGGKQSYIVSLGIVYVVPGLLAIGLLFIPESPRWLLQMDQEEKARKSLVWLRPFPDLVPAELLEMKTAIDAEKALAENSEIMDIIRNPVDRRRTLLAIGAVTLQAASGAMYMICKKHHIPIGSEHQLICPQHMAHTSSKWLVLVHHSRTLAF